MQHPDACHMEHPCSNPDMMVLAAGAVSDSGGGKMAHRG